MSTTTQVVVLLGPGGAEVDTLTAQLPALGFRVHALNADADDCSAQLAHLVPDVVLLGPLGPEAEPWESRVTADLRALAVVAFGDHAEGLRRVIANGVAITVLLTPLSVEAIGLALASIVAHHHRDVQTAEAHETTLALVHAVLHESPLAIYAKDAQMRFLLSNRRHTELIGRPRSEVVGATDVTLFGEEGIAIDALSRRVFQTGQPQSSEFTLALHGVERTFQETIFPVRLDSGKRIGVAGIAIDLTDVRRQQAMLAERLEELDRNMRVSALTSECVELVQRCVTVEESLELTSRYFAQMYPQANLTVYKKQEAHHDLTLHTKALRFEPMSAPDILEGSDCWAVRTRRVYATLPEGSRIPCRHLAGAQGACTCAPLFAMDRLIGLVSLVMPPPESTHLASYAEETARWVAQVDTTMQSIAGALSTVMLRESLQRLALVDELTGMPNRRAFVTQAQRALARARRAHEKVAVAVFDLDHFRHVNDRWGRDAGDRILQQVAEISSGFFRADDILARVGGEQFAALLLLNSQADAVRLLDNFRTEIALRCRMGQQLITVSIGFCFTDPALSTPVEELLQQAKSAVGEAKRAGRDRVMQAGTATPRSSPPPSPISVERTQRSKSTP